MDRRILAGNNRWRGGEPASKALHSLSTCLGRQGRSTPDLRGASPSNGRTEAGIASGGRRCAPGPTASAANGLPPHLFAPAVLQLGISLLDRLQFTSKGKDYLHTIDYTADDDPAVPMPQTAGKPVR